MNLTLLSTTLLLIIISNVVIRALLQNKIKKSMLNLISNVVVLPGIPLLWFMSDIRSFSSNVFWDFYFPLIITIFLILMLIINLVRFIKDIDR
ncbi:hypothetical protein BAMA_04165 [Bacillus manliponensis]|uniref:Uncharacterized protein n=1 Tax=Bacillus manliponensis TaxID=574376 RepID=A0A073JUH6_9BACI|nr:hypothetical protein [Bacillus manliponensis]KEK18709.1 hypothetical protein BAMA_04165 [Bacillus manliponensis]